MDASAEQRDYVRVRVTNACDSCKARKVKCDGKLPCSYCTRHQRANHCRFSPQRKRRSNHPRSPRPLSASDPSAPARPETRLSTRPIPTVPPTTENSTSPATVRNRAIDISVEEEAEVPRDARLLCDAQGKLIFVGDCAPLSFFQTVRQLVTVRVDPYAFSRRTSCASLFGNTESSQPLLGLDEPHIKQEAIGPAVANYLSVTSGLLDFFDHRLGDEIAEWAANPQKARDVDVAVKHLILAIGLQSSDGDAANRCFNYAKMLALTALGGDLSVSTVQAFTLITIYMLRACQITGAFLFFGIAVRALYTLGVHRTEVNSRFGPDIQRQRDRLWTSLRIVDLYLSISMGRPPATSDVDCTVPYRSVDEEGHETFDLLNASVQILLITEGIVLELRDWSSRWLLPLKRISASPTGTEYRQTFVGACQVLCTYYYAVMLLSRPFLMYEMCKRLPESTCSLRGTSGTNGSGHSKLANACIDAASLMIESVTDFIQVTILDLGPMPVIVSWLFSASLVVGVGLLGDFGRILDKYARMSISALDHFAKHDTHAAQYSHIINSLHKTATKYIERKEMQERLQINESSSQLFGLIPRERREAGDALLSLSRGGAQSMPTTQADMEPIGLSQSLSSPFGEFDPSSFSFSDSASGTPDFSLLSGSGDQTDQVFGALNLFPLLEGGGQIDLAHFM